jgi:hypothetical protein
MSSKAKRQASHHCPACHRYSMCAREQWMAECPVPRDVMCGSCVERAHRAIRAWSLLPKARKPRDKRKRLNKKAGKAT